MLGGRETSVQKSEHQVSSYLIGNGKHPFGASRTLTNPTPERTVTHMAWLYLLLAGLCEIFYAAAIPRTKGFTRLGPSVFCLLFIAASMYLLALATRTIPIGTAYAVWVGIGAIGTAIYGITILGEDRSALRLLCFVLILAGIVGLKLISAKTAA